jgi:AcrR family transcriptional regulator
VVSGERDTAADVLDAAAALFTSVGYAATTTRAIAERAGVRQATLYHHYAAKHDLLLPLLDRTVRPSLDLADRLARRTEPAPALLWALCRADVALLCSGPDNLGALYLLPEVAAHRVPEFDALRDRLRVRYTELVAATVANGGGDTVDARPLATLVLGLVESVILQRRDDPGLDGDEVGPRVADGALRLVGLPADVLDDVREVGQAVLAALAPPVLGESSISSPS